ncbi:MAG: succinylglutamate desuccinylase/aspartoacylase family protein [Saprospiraceae bacterium]
MEESSPFQVHNTIIPKGSQMMVKIPVGRIPSGNLISIQAHVIRSKNDGPTALVLGGVHGDEVNGVEIVRRSIEEGLYNDLQAGTVIAIPVVNIYGFINFSRDVPDGKDINRSFPGSRSGSLASRVAFHLSRKILPLADFGIDFHTGGRGNFNYPQIRYTTGHEESEQLAKVFAPPILLAKKTITKSLRKYSMELEIPMLVYEGGENLRMDPYSTTEGLEGLKRVLIHKKMLPGEVKGKTSGHFAKSSWIRSPKAGMFQFVKKSGDTIKKGEVIGFITDAYGLEKHKLMANRDGHIIGHNNLPVVSQGDALFHVAYEAIV